jgi:hypothetical protein
MRVSGRSMLRPYQNKLGARVSDAQPKPKTSV